MMQNLPERRGWRKGRRARRLHGSPSLGAPTPSSLPLLRVAGGAASALGTEASVSLLPSSSSKGCSSHSFLDQVVVIEAAIYKTYFKIFIRLVHYFCHLDVGIC